MHDAKSTAGAEACFPGCEGASVSLCDQDGATVSRLAAAWLRPILDVTAQGKQALKVTHLANILDDSLSDLRCESSTCE
jgi:hypothetical protein